jgi:putative ubiquitin-RnfH superfamily antitoxin RatB of RatAB toxin-antitoxin module
MSSVDANEVEVIYALPDRQRVALVTLEPGLTAMTAVETSGLRGEFPELENRALDLAVFGRKVRADYVLQAGDRVEILRPLLMDPREARRQLAARGETMGRR